MADAVDLRSVQFESGCYAWGKMRGFPYWPCVVYNSTEEVPPELKKKKKVDGLKPGPNELICLFLDSFNYSIVEKANVRAVSELDEEQVLSTAKDARQRSRLKAAIESMKEELDSPPSPPRQQSGQSRAVSGLKRGCAEVEADEHQDQGSSCNSASPAKAVEGPTPAQGGRRDSNLCPPSAPVRPPPPPAKDEAGGAAPLAPKEDIGKIATVVCGGPALPKGFMDGSEGGQRGPSKRRRRTPSSLLSDDVLVPSLAGPSSDEEREAAASDEQAEAWLVGEVDKLKRSLLDQLRQAKGRVSQHLQARVATLEKQVGVEKRKASKLEGDVRRLQGLVKGLEEERDRACGERDAAQRELREYKEEMEQAMSLISLRS